MTSGGVLYLGYSVPIFASEILPNGNGTSAMHLTHTLPWLGYMLAVIFAITLIWLARRLLHVHRAFRDSTSCLKNEAAQLETILGVIDDGVIRLSARGRVLHMNNAAEVLTGWSNRDAQNMRLDDVVKLYLVEQSAQTNEFIRADNPALECMLNARDVFPSHNFLLRGRSNKVRVIEAYASAILDSRGELENIVLVLRNISEYIHLEKRIRHQNTHDPLTGFFNRSEFENRIRMALQEAKQEGTQYRPQFLA